MSDPNDDFFVGYADTPQADRRFFLKAGLGLMAGTLVTAGGVAALQTRPGPGTWNQGDVRDWMGVVTAEPYAMLRTSDLDGTPKTMPLSCLGKCGVAAQIRRFEGRVVQVRGSLIQRGEHAMIAVPELEPDWIGEVQNIAEDTSTPGFPDTEPMGDIDLMGEIVDTKCWFGAMRPSEGKVHKACAALCIRSGLPPALLARDREKRETLMIMTDGGKAYGEDLLALVADPVRVRGSVSRWGNLLLLDAPTRQIQRV